MKLINKILKWALYVLLIPLSYILVSLILSSITVDRKAENQTLDKTIYLSTNGVHLEIVIPKSNLDSRFLSEIKHQQFENFLSFGWGDEEFYLNTPTWGDLTISTALKAAFWKSPTLIHVTRYQTIQPKWIEIKVSESELEKLNRYILNTFKTDSKGKVIILENQGYGATDDFYKAPGSYYFYKTCNSWVNTGFKESGLKACVWNPFDFGLLNKYE